MFSYALLLCLLSLPAMALNYVTTSVYQIDLGKDNEDTLVLLNSGQVAKLPVGKSQILIELKAAVSRGGQFNFILDDDRNILELDPIPSALPLTKHFKALPDRAALQDYVPTTVASMDLAKKYFRKARYNPKDSQCFNRAHVWSYEWWRDHSLRSQKILIYFTRTYIRRYNFEWWFHIAPYIHVMENDRVVERIMDIKYSRGPIEFRRWTNLFMRNDAECKIISKFSDYADYPYTGECYLQRANMYTYQPADLQMNEAWGYTKDRFNMAEVRQAYLEAFDENL